MGWARGIPIGHITGSPRKGRAKNMRKLKVMWVLLFACARTHILRNKLEGHMRKLSGIIPIKNDVEIVQNQLGIEHGFVVTNRQRASSSRKRVKVAEERSLQPAEEVTKLLEKLDKMRRCFSSNCSSRHHGSSNINGLHQIPNSSRPRQAGISRRHQHGGNISTTHEHHHNHHLNE
ncbi:uncharacterized protein LOC132300323 isoform X4 [Cornus florida]|uniref:uncharacterized protein LOC132300323 isoform X4 n=1 Tax=Cornus florida TaxID=4283 RepID=UPI0028A12CEA|nr:uncharacterized protein LOC132300323 isoform X4 [Cornus florida]XP_059653334.1 uncharacterized protein LOC132300323 isoform X4 [Cornus florida]